MRQLSILRSPMARRLCHSCLLALNKVSKKLNHDNDAKLFTKPNREKRRTKKPQRIKKEHTQKEE